MDASRLVLANLYFGVDFYRVRETCLLSLNVTTVLVFFTPLFSGIL